MNTNRSHKAWARLTAAARQVRDERDSAPPYGFSTRVAALALAGRRAGASVFERLALRAVGVACLLAIASVALNYSALTRPVSSDEQTAAEVDPMAVLLDL